MLLLPIRQEHRSRTIVQIHSALQFVLGCKYSRSKIFATLDKAQDYTLADGKGDVKQRHQTTEKVVHKRKLTQLKWPGLTIHLTGKSKGQVHTYHNISVQSVDRTCKQHTECIRFTLDASSSVSERFLDSTISIHTKTQTDTQFTHFCLFLCVWPCRYLSKCISISSSPKFLLLLLKLRLVYQTKSTDPYLFPPLKNSCRRRKTCRSCCTMKISLSTQKSINPRIKVNSTKVYEGFLKSSIDEITCLYAINKC